MLGDSLNNFFSKFFPTPYFLASPSFGIDLSDDSLKFVELIGTKNGIKVNRYGERKIPAGIIESGKIKEPRRLQELLATLRKEEGIKFVRVSFPEDQIYLFKLRLGKSGLKSVREAIDLCLEEHIPIPAPDAIFDYELIEETKDNLEIQVGAIPKNVIENYFNVFKNALMIVRSFEVEAQSIARAVIKKGDKDTYMIVDFGEKRTGIFIISRGVVMFTSTLDIGGVVLNSMIQKSFNISYEEADMMKKEYGLKRNTDNKEIFAVILNSVSILRDELAKHFLYWHTHQDEKGRNNPPIKKILLCGGDSNLIGLADYFSISMNTKVEMANVWVNITGTNKNIPEINFKRALSLASALGLALGNFDRT